MIAAAPTAPRTKGTTATIAQMVRAAARRLQMATTAPQTLAAHAAMLSCVGTVIAYGAVVNVVPKSKRIKAAAQRIAAKMVTLKQKKNARELLSPQKSIHGSPVGRRALKRAFLR
jgi:hypothetical protein